ncbi:MAG: chromate transporter [Ruminococcaceae bacterium]|nr:chromate transporter [Oscillospiraceae bacterium]
MIYLDLFLGFLKVGCFAFGGAYGAIPLIRDVVLSYGWLNDEMLTYMIAVSESTPRPIMVNLATYIGSSQAGFFGAVIATLAVVLPSFLIILLVTALLKTVLKNKYVQAVLRGLKPCVIGIVLATGIYMVLGNCFGTIAELRFHVQSVIITAALAAAMIGCRHIAKKKLSPILLIVLSAAAGIVVYGV